MTWKIFYRKYAGWLIVFLLLLVTLWSAGKMGIISKLYLGLPTSPSELLTNGTFEDVAGDDFANWTETIPAFAELAENGDLELVAGNNFNDWTEHVDGTGTITDEGVEVHGDSHSVKAVGGTGFAEIYQSETVVIGDTHTMGIWVKGDWWIWLAEGAYPNYTDLQGTSADWEYQTITRTQTTTTTMYMTAHAHTGDTAYFDDISVWKTRGNIERTATAHAGDDGVLITGAWTNTQPYLYQDIVSDPGDYHRFSFWSKGDGSNGVKYTVYDNTNSALITSGEGPTSTSWTEKVVTYYVPEDCVSIRITFTGNGSDEIYLDDASVLEYGPVTWTENTDVMAVPAPTWGYGLGGKDPLRGLAETGTANFTLDNRENYYSPENAAKLSGFEEGMPVKITNTLPAAVVTREDILSNGGFEDVS